MELDCRGLPCPGPVLKTKDALENFNGESLKVIVDNKAARENVKRFAESKGFKVDVDEGDGVFILTIFKDKKNEEIITEKKDNKDSGDYVVLIASTYVGEERELGEILIKGFIKTFIEASPLPKGIVLINTAVKLACKGGDEEIIEALKTLESKGVRIICCGTCLNYYDLIDEVVVGEPSNAYDVVQFLANAKSVIRL